MSGKMWVEISRFKLNGTCQNMEVLINHQPANILELSFWCELMFVAKIDQDDVPENGVFYLHDRIYEEVISTLQEHEKGRIKFKIELLIHILGMSSSIDFGLAR